MKRVLLTGGSGRLGQALIPQLQAAGYAIRVLSRRPAGPSQGPGVEWVRADLQNGVGLAEAVDGAEIIIHAASNPFKRQVDVQGTALLLEEAQKIGVAQFVYVSIAGIERIEFGYYKNKLAAEQLIEASSVPWTILRATQFHSFVDLILRALTRLPLAFVPTDWQFQSISEVEVANHLLAAVDQGATGRLPDIGGPAILGLDEMARSWMAAQNLRRRIVHLPVPGGLSAGFRQGLNTVPQNRAGKITWDRWLASRYAAKPQETVASTPDEAGKEKILA